ncbi:glycerate dehydrogenase [Exophiala viscosa]|uniref:Glycerate dehydrogenase n=1 Tax=Exophiala viscosa TaxID=2486360 RepID=A0AAN6DS15_9EURO|nr:glycerate dehydrogenase [Exophiala viscosa]
MAMETPSTTSNPSNPSTGASRIKIVALEARFGPIPDFDTFKGEFDIDTAIYDQTVRDDLEVLNERLRDAEIAIICTMPMTAATLAPEVTPNLRAISISAAGTDHVDLEYCRKRGIRVLNSPRANTETVAEHAIALFFAARRAIVQTHIQTVHDQWPKKKTLVTSLRGKNDALPLGLKEETVGIVGYGGVGKHIAKLCTGLGMTVLIADRKSSTTTETQGTAPTSNGSNAMTRCSFTQILQSCTVIFVAIPRLPSTMNMISASEFAMMSSRAVLVNVSRGGIVNESDLLVALRERQIAGAATDVFLVEPAWTENSVLVKALAEEETTVDGEKLPLVVTPHAAWYSEVTMGNLTKDAERNVVGWLRGNPPPENVVV